MLRLVVCTLLLGFFAYGDSSQSGRLTRQGLDCFRNPSFESAAFKIPFKCNGQETFRWVCFMALDCYSTKEHGGKGFTRSELAGETPLGHFGYICPAIENPRVNPKKRKYPICPPENICYETTFRGGIAEVDTQYVPPDAQQESRLDRKGNTSPDTNALVHSGSKRRSINSENGFGHPTHKVFAPAASP
ncbi:MAG: hypothetical protein HY537_01830 [Deltaproteobacteria bacterium]|nr:hypothetical protein [Deltaproteobacteria bacterium]